VKIDGSIGGNANVDVGEAKSGEGMPPGFPFMPDLPTVPSAPAGLTIGKDARIGGDLNYTAIDKITVPSGVVAGETNFTQYVPETAGAEAEAPPQATGAARAGVWFVSQLRQLITLLLAGALMMWLVPDWTRKVASIVQTKPLPSLGWGVVAIAAFVLAILVLIIATVLLAVVFGIVTLGELAGRFVALGGITMGAATFVFSVTWAYATKIVVSLLLGQLIFGLFKSTAAENRWWPVLLGVLIFVIIAAIPVLGWLAKLVTVLLGLGAIWMWGRDWLSSRKAEQVAVESESPGASPQD